MPVSNEDLLKEGKVKKECPVCGDVVIVKIKRTHPEQAVRITENPANHSKVCLSKQKLSKREQWQNV